MPFAGKTIDSRYINFLIILVYGLMLAVVMAHHELWRDETQAWLIAKASKSPLDIFANNTYEGHPPLWILILWPIAHLTDNPEWIRLPHFILTIGTAWLVLRYAPFPRWVSGLMLFGYYFFYEYSVLCRNYQLGLLGIVAFLSFYGLALRKPWVALVCLSISVWANVYAMILSSILALYFLIDMLKQVKKPGTILNYKKHAIIASAIFMALLVSMVFVVQPPSDGAFIKWNFGFDWPTLQYTFTSYFRTLLPIPRAELSFWNNSIFVGRWVPYAGVLLMFGLVLTLTRYPKFLFWMLMMLVALLSFQYLKYVGFLRHSGHHWIAFVAILWILTNRYGWQQIYWPLKALFVGLVAVHLMAGILAASFEIKYTFAAGQQTAGFIYQQHWQERTIIAHTDYSTSSVAAFLNKPLYYTMIGDSGTFVKWTIERKKDDFGKFLVENRAQLMANADKFIVLTSFPIVDYPWLRQVFDSGAKVVWDERLYVYTIDATNR